ncbi:MAG TPA: hypothetical protein VG757_11285 [Devosia sp.]|nr:hypothetical protein [Devosia sp.]
MPIDSAITFKTRAPVTEDDLNTLFGKAYNKKMSAPFHKILNTTLTWVTAHKNGELVGWIHVAWDGFVHALLIDRTAVDDESGAIRTELVKQAIKTIERDHPTVFKIHMDLKESEMAEFIELGLQPLPGGILQLKR